MFKKGKYLNMVLYIITLGKMALVHIFGERPIPKVLDFFRVNQFWDYSLKDVALETKISYTTLQKVIPELVRGGILQPTRSEGKAKLYQFNNKSRLAVELQKIARESDLEFGEKLAEENKEPVRVVSIAYAQQG
jgi:hypothetical protein